MDVEGLHRLAQQADLEQVVLGFVGLHGRRVLAWFRNPEMYSSAESLTWGHGGRSGSLHGGGDPACILPLVGWVPDKHLAALSRTTMWGGREARGGGKGGGAGWGAVVCLSSGHLGFSAAA